MESGVFFSDYRRDMALRRLPLEKARMALFVAALLVFPFFASPYWLNLANQIAIATVGALGLNILVGYTGQISMGQGAFMALLVQVMRARLCIEVGTFTGYSALAVAQALPEGGQLICCDVSR
ncbi:MAG: hypothetical protein R3190_00705, partial [Thermoanaerobaculia bacterium]|nr:hypothetical protein [Thermoanaerobaculia bacterium]